VQSTLRGTAAFATVDTYDTRSTGIGGPGTTPTLSQLAAYDAVFVFSFAYFAQTDVLGDRLAAFHDQGGGVVLACFAITSDFGGNTLGGAYGSPGNGYALLNYTQGNRNEYSDTLGDVLEPQSPLMVGVASLNASVAHRTTAPPITGRAVVVARWRGGGQEPLVLRGMRGDRTLVELNFSPPSSNVESHWWTGDGAQLMRNALKYSRCMPCGKGAFADAGAGSTPPLLILNYLV
jgi:hypothetical protein